jgi:sulfide dehydrogenase cytochrome subunit
VKPRIFILLAGIFASPMSNAAEPGVPRPSAATLAHACAGCHGTFGHSHAATPSINGKSEAEFIQLMQEFRSGQRQASVMNRIARGYTDEDFKSLARFFRNQ